jgi:hypothetical protein
MKKGTKPTNWLEDLLLNNMGSCGFEGKYLEEKNSYFRQIAREFFLPEP